MGAKTTPYPKLALNRPRSPKAKLPTLQHPPKPEDDDAPKPPEHRTLDEEIPSTVSSTAGPRKGSLGEVCPEQGRKFAFFGELGHCRGRHICAAMVRRVPYCTTR